MKNAVFDEKVRGKPSLGGRGLPGWVGSRELDPGGCFQFGVSNASPAWVQQFSSGSCRSALMKGDVDEVLSH